jgi:predicted anti-sigma-YlaC factor YlaD
VKCTDFFKELTDYLDGIIDPQLKSDLEEHLIWCHDCRIVYDTTQKTIHIYKDSQPYDLPDDVRTRLQSAIMSKCKAACTPKKTT